MFFPMKVYSVFYESICKKCTTTSRKRHFSKYQIGDLDQFSRCCLKLLFVFTTSHNPNSLIGFIWVDLGNGSPIKLYVTRKVASDYWFIDRDAASDKRLRRNDIMVKIAVYAGKYAKK